MKTLTYLLLGILYFFIITCETSTDPKDESKAGYKLIKHTIQTELPAYVNIMFQVTDLDGKGVDNLITDNFEVLEDAQAVSPTESAMQIRKKDAIPYTLKTVLLLDNSVSVGDKLDEIKNAAIALVENIETQQEIAIYKFSDKVELVIDFSSDISSLKNAINSINLGFASTNLYGAIIKGVSRWRDDAYSLTKIEQGFLMALTDGSDTQGSFTLQQALDSRADKKVYTIGLGSEIDPEVLKELGNAGYFSITNVSELTKKFTEIQADMALYANSFYWLNYMSPKRGNKNHTLKLYVKDNSNTDTDSYIEGEFNSDGFYSVYSGLYINSDETNPYGIDSLNILVNDSLNISAVTYLGNNPPEYEWISGSQSIIKVTQNENDQSIAKIIAVGDSGQTTTLTVNDIANSMSKTISIFIGSKSDFVTDIDGNIYQVVQIGSQWWMSENLKVTHYRNGESIPHVTDNTSWTNLSTGASCAYDNDNGNVAMYGLLYNWYAVDDSRNIAPAGWHVPTDEEWKELEMYLGMSQSEADGTGYRGTDEGGKLKETGTTHWNSPNTGATNESGFTALPGGYRYFGNGAYYDVGYSGFWWSATGYSSTYAWYRYLNYNYSDVSRGNYIKRNGFSVRLVRD